MFSLRANSVLFVSCDEINNYSSVNYTLAPADQGYKKALAAFDLSLQQLKRSHLDLYLIHWPGVQGLQRDDPQNARIRKESWKALEELNRNGRVFLLGG